MTSGVSRLDDAAFLFSAWTGLRAADDRLDIKTSILESNVEEDVLNNIRYFAYDGYDCIWAIGYNTQAVVEEVAPKFPNIPFVVVDGNFDPIPGNVVSVGFAEHHGAYLVGYLAATLSEAGHVGFLGGEEIDLIKRFEAGFLAGTRCCSGAIDVSCEYAGSFVSYAAGRAAADRLIELGCDIIFHAAGSAGKGAIRTAKQRGIYIIGVDTDQRFLAPGTVITSMVKRLDRAVDRLTEEVLEGRVTGGGHIAFSLADNAIALADIEHPKVNDDVLEIMGSLRQKIIDGEITVPETV